MLEAIIIAGIVYLVFKGGSLNISAATAPVIHNATGGSLSATLGSSNAPPSQYATGQTGYAVNQSNTSVNSPNTHLAGPSASPSKMSSAFTQQPALPVNRAGLAGRTIPPAHNGVVYATGVRPNANNNVQAPTLVVAPSRVVAYNPATNRNVTINPAITQGTVATVRNSPEVASPFWASTIKSRKIATY